MMAALLTIGNRWESVGLSVASGLEPIHLYNFCANMWGQLGFAFKPKDSYESALAYSRFGVYRTLEEMCRKGFAV